MWKLDPITRQRLKRFRSIRRGYWSFWGLISLIAFSLVGELFINNRALVVSYQGQLFFPTYGGIVPGKNFGLDYSYETNYRDLRAKFKAEGKGDWMIMPLIPFNAYENDLKEGSYPPFAPSMEDGHYLGTDKVGRDIVARLVFGFRIAIFFSLGLLLVDFGLGITIGSMMAYFGGWFDILMSRAQEIWSNVPFLYVVIIISSIVVPNFWVLIFIMALFGWMGVATYMRTTVYREKAREYATAAEALGCSPARIMFRHILPNSVSILITLLPFAVTSGISSLTALDYLGFGLSAPTPSWGELLNQGTENLESKWIVVSVVVCMVVILTMVTFIGEAIREAFDPKKYTVYR